MFPFLGFFHSLLLYVRFTGVICVDNSIQLYGYTQFVYSLMMDTGLFPALGYYKSKPLPVFTSLCMDSLPISLV